MASTTASDPNVWIDRFLKRYAAKVAPFDWPTDPDDWREFVAAWVASFRRHGIEEGEANAAAVQLAECPPTYRRDHLPAVIAVIQSHRPSTDPASRTTSERMRREHEARVRDAKGAKLSEAWDALPESRREAIRAAVIAENPGLARWEAFVRPLCLAKLQEGRW